jgi:hypothetical protein
VIVSQSNPASFCVGLCRLVHWAWLTNSNAPIARISAKAGHYKEHGQQRCVSSCRPSRRLRASDAPSDFRSPRQRKAKTDTLKAVFTPGFIFLVVMAGDSMLRRGEGGKLEARDFTTRLISGAE